MVPRRLVLPVALTVAVVGTIGGVLHGCTSSRAAPDAQVADATPRDAADDTATDVAVDVAIDAPIDTPIDMAPDTPIG